MKSASRGQKVVQFIEGFCLTPEGKHVGQPMKLLGFQKRFIKDIYDNKHGTSRAILSVARKNGKTALIAAICLAHIVGPEAQQNSQIISGARSRDQAALIFKLAEKMVRLSPQLSEYVRIVPSSKMLVGLPMNVEYKAISADAGTAHGLSPILAILDEAGQVRGPQDAFIEAIETAQGAHEQPLLIAISTQAPTDNDLFNTWIDDAQNAKDPRTVCHVYAAEEGCEISDKKAWKAANPALGQFRSLKDMEDFAKTAERLPAKENSFRWLYLNQRVEGTSLFLAKSEWEANAEMPSVMPQMTCYAGLDLSASRDLTALALVFPENEQYHVKMHFFLPSEGIVDRSKSERVPYNLWAEAGFLTLIDGPVINPSYVAKALIDVSVEYNLRMLAYDRWRINDLKRELDILGADLPMIPFGQGFKDMSPAIDRLEQLVASRKLRHGGNPVLNMCAAGAVVERDPAGNRKLTKSKSVSKIDGLVALAMALGAAHQMEEPPTHNPWDDEGFSLTALIK